MLPHLKSLKSWVNFLKDYTPVNSSVSYMETGDETTNVFLFGDLVVWHTYALFEDDDEKNHREIEIGRATDRSLKGYELIKHNPYGPSIIPEDNLMLSYYLDGEYMEYASWNKLKKNYLVRDKKVQTLKKKLSQL